MPNITDMFWRLLAAVLVVGCGGGVSVLPEPFTRERLDGKIPVKTDLIREQVRKELDEIPEAEAERWQVIETDYNQCRLSSARATKSEAEQVFSVCMSERGYVYMNRIEAKELHDSIADKVYEERQVAKRRAEEERQAAARHFARLAEEERQAAEETKRKAEEQRQADAIKAERERLENNLQVYARDGELSEVRRLLADGVNVNAENNEGGWTALHLAVAEGHAETVKVLIAAGANVNAASKYGRALYSAAPYGHTEVAKILIAAGANVHVKHDGRTALHMAAINGHTEFAKVLIAAGANVNADNDSVTALHVAAYNGHTEVVKILIAAGAKVNASVDDGWTALHVAAGDGHAEIAKILIAARADVNAVENDGWTPLHLAAQEGNTEVVKVLIAAGANANAVDNEGFTALYVAAQKGYTEIAKLLIAAGANANAATNDNGNTALHAAADNGHAEVAKVLLECGASPDIRENNGNNAWDFANQQPLVNVVFQRFYEEAKQGRTYPPCHNQQSDSVGITAVAKPTKTTNIAEQVFDNTWRLVVIIENGDNQGSGVIVRPNVVATNCHVVDSDDKIIVYKSDERKAATDSVFHATIRHADNVRDFCLLDVAGLWGIAATVRQYNTLKVGEDVYNLGAPKGLDLSLSSGIISQLREFDGQRWIQTDAAISPGSSGGGMFDSQGNLIGITTQKLVSEDAEGIGFAIPADLILGL